MAYRASYGADAYGTELYGVTGAIDAAATVTPTISVTCSAVTVNNASAAITASLTAAVSGYDTVKDASATITLQSATVSVGEEYVETDGYRPGYGLRTYGSSIYGQNNSTEEGTATIAIATSMSVSAARTRNVTAAISATATLTTSSVFTVVGAASLALGLNITTAAQRQRLASSTSTIALTIATSAREKWEPVPPTSEIWTPVTFSRAA